MPGRFAGQILSDDRRMSMIRFTMILLIAGSVLMAAGSPELLIAIRNGDHTQVQKRLRDGAGVHTADSDGTTALMHSVSESYVKMMKLLIASGADVNARIALDS